MLMDAWVTQQQRLDQRHGIIAALIANTNRRQGTKVFQPSDFMPRYEEQKRQPVDQMELWNKVDQTMRMLGGR